MLTRIQYDRLGQGPPFVLLHGIGHHRQAWRPVTRLLADEFDLIACDTPGFGASPRLPEDVRPTIGAYVDAFRRLFLELGVERPHVAGNSMGGGIALELARAGEVSSACALSPIGFWSERERRFSRASLRYLVAETPALVRPAVRALARTRAGRAVLFAQLCAWPSRIPAEEAVDSVRAAWAAPAFVATLEAFSDYDFVAGEDLCEVPVTVAWGVRDRLLPYRRQAPRARARLPRARHLALGAGHLPYFDDPAAVAEVLRSSAWQAQPGRRAAELRALPV